MATMTTDEFEAIFEKVQRAITDGSIDDGLDETERRRILHDRLSRHGYDVTGEVAAVPQRPDPLDVDDLDEPRELIIPDAPTEPYWYDAPEDARLLDHHILARRKLGAAMSGGLLITGPAGSGKSQSVPQALLRLNHEHGLNLQLLRMECPTITDPQKWFGRREIDKDGTRYEKSDFIIGVERGDVILLDEAWRLHPHLVNPIMTLIDSSEMVHLSDLNVTIHRHPQTVFIATANEGSRFSGNHRPDWAFRERFPFTIERGFPPAKEEAKILISQTGVDPDGASRLVAIADKTRQLVERGDLGSPISTRTLVAAAWLVASGLTEVEALRATAVPLYDRDSNGITTGEASERQKVLHIMEGKLG